MGKGWWLALSILEVLSNLNESIGFEVMAKTSPWITAEGTAWSQIPRRPHIGHESSQGTELCSTLVPNPSPAIAPWTQDTAGNPEPPRPVAGDMDGSRAGTFGFADSGVVSAAALVVVAEGVTLALLQGIETLITATFTGVCKSTEGAQ